MLWSWGGGSCVNSWVIFALAAVAFSWAPFSFQAVFLFGHCLCCILLSLGLFQKASDTVFFFRCFKHLSVFFYQQRAAMDLPIPPKKIPRSSSKKWCKASWRTQIFFKNRRMEEKLGGGNSNIFYFHPYLGRWSKLTNIFQIGWNHQLVGGGNSNIFYVHPYLGKISNLTSIFFRWVGSTTNWKRIVKLGSFCRCFFCRFVGPGLLWFVVVGCDCGWVVFFCTEFVVDVGNAVREEEKPWSSEPIPIEQWMAGALRKLLVNRVPLRCSPSQ